MWKFGEKLLALKKEKDAAMHSQISMITRHDLSN
jgi:hypothetical protein